MPRLFTGLEIPPSVAQTLSIMRGGLPGAGDRSSKIIILLCALSATSTIRWPMKLPECSGVSIGRLRIAPRRVDFVWRLQAHARSSLPLAPIAALMELQAEHERIAGSGRVRARGRKYTPHVTLARLRDTSSWRSPLSRRPRPLSFRAVSGFALCAVLVTHFGRRRPLYRRGRLSARRAGAQVGLNIRVCKSSIAVAKP